MTPQYSIIVCVCANTVMTFLPHSFRERSIDRVQGPIKMFLRQIKSDLDLDCISCKKVWRRGHGRQAVPLPKYGSPLFYDWCKALKVTFPEGTEPRRLHVCQDHFPPGTTDCSTLLPINTTPVEESNTDIEETPILANSEITSESRIDLAEGAGLSGIAFSTIVPWAGVSMALRGVKSAPSYLKNGMSWRKMLLQRSPLFEF